MLLIQGIGKKIRKENIQCSKYVYCKSSKYEQGNAPLQQFSLEVYVPFIASKSGHETKQHVLAGARHDVFHHQTFEVSQPLRQTVMPKV